MNEIIKNTTDLIEQGGEFLKQPAVAGLFSGLKNWVSNLLTRNKAAKEKLAEALKAKDQLTVLQVNLEFMEKWNAEMQAELEEKEKEIDTFAKRAGLNLSGSTNINSITGNTVTSMQGNIVAGSGHTLGSSNKLDTDSLVYAIENLKRGDSVEKVAKILKIDKDLLSRIAEVLK